MTIIAEQPHSLYKNPQVSWLFRFRVIVKYKQTFTTP